MKNLTKLFTVAIGFFVASYANTQPAKASSVEKNNPGLYNCNGKIGHCATTPSGVLINGDCRCSDSK